MRGPVESDWMMMEPKMVLIVVFAITMRSEVEERRVGCVEEREEEEGARTTYRPKEDSEMRTSKSN